MDGNELMQQTRDTLTVARLFGGPLKRNGLTVVRVAVVRGGGGGGKARVTLDPTQRAPDPVQAAALG